MGGHATFLRVLIKDAPKDEVCRNGGGVLNKKHKTSESDHARTDAYVDDTRRLDARFCAKFAQGEIGGRFPPTSQLQSLGVFLSVIAYRKWNFTALCVSREFPKTNPIGRWIYVYKPLSSGEKIPETRGVDY